MRSHADIIETIEWEAASRDANDAASMFRELAEYCTGRAELEGLVSDVTATAMALTN